MSETSDKQTKIPALPAELIAEKASECSRIVPKGFHVFVGALQKQFGDSLQAVLLYGSCLHNYDLENSVVDLYVVVDDYYKAYDKALLCMLNRYVPPNVFYLEVEFEGVTLRCKYGVISMNDFEEGASSWFHSYIWGRFAQPTRLLYTCNNIARDRMHTLLAQATLTFLRASVPALGRSIVDTETIWSRGLALSYEAELRPEQKNRARQLTHLNMGDYIRITACAAPALSNLEALPHDRYNCIVGERDCRRALRRWRLRAWQGRLLSVLRLIKAVFTFRDCVDYAAWKIERHTGIKIEITPQLQRHPILFGWKVLLQLVRQGVMH
jgi:Phosphatidate cytidylyltransferase, mitochondrial